MAFSAAELSKIRFVLGYASTPAWANTWLNTTVATVSSASPEDESLARLQLVEIADIEAQLTDARKNRLKVSEVEGIKMLGAAELRELRREASRYAGAIGTILGVEKVGDPYSNSSGGGALRVG